MIYLEISSYYMPDVCVMMMICAFVLCLVKAGDHVMRCGNSVLSLSFSHTHTHTRLTALCPGLPGWASTRKVKPIWILLKLARDSEWQLHYLGHMQVCTPVQTDNHASTPPLSFFTCRMPFLTPNQQRQSAEGIHTGIEFNSVLCSHFTVTR